VAEESALNNPKSLGTGLLLRNLISEEEYRQVSHKHGVETIEFLQLLIQQSAKLM
jgi:hypothetical protein